MRDRIRIGDLVVSAPIDEWTTGKVQRWMRRGGIIDRAAMSGINIKWLSHRPEIVWMVMDDICPELINFTHSSAASELLGISFLKCRAPDGEIVFCPEMMVRRL
jgi:hypothetical protein